MVMQRQKARHAAEIAYERDNGGSDPVLPDFWDEGEQLETLEANTASHRQFSDQPVAGPSNPYTPPHITTFRSPAVERPHAQYMTDATPIDEDVWAMEAARAEAAEREAEEAEMARQCEEEMHHSQRTIQQNDLEGMDLDIDIDWDMESQ